MLVASAFGDDEDTETLKGGGKVYPQLTDYLFSLTSHILKPRICKSICPSLQSRKTSPWVVNTSIIDTLWVCERKKERHHCHGDSHPWALLPLPRFFSTCDVVAKASACLRHAYQNVSLWRSLTGRSKMHVLPPIPTSSLTFRVY